MGTVVSYLALALPFVKTLLSAFNLVQFSPVVDAIANVITSVAAVGGGHSLYLTEPPAKK